MINNIFDLTQKLISIPSWVDDRCDETAIGEFIFNFLKDNTSLTVTKQFVVGKRFNILARNGQDVKTLIIGHIDTVGVSSDWSLNPIISVIKDGRLYGRGATDMKSGLAAMLLLSLKPDLPKNTGFLFYVDEEYSFLGMKQFLQEFKDIIKPKTIISLDGSQLEIANGCRGLLEIELTIQGKSCHAATPQNGVNAITTAVSAVELLQDVLSSYQSQELGISTVNLASITGGVNDANGIRQTTPNVVPDICRLTLDIRPSDPRVTAQFVLQNLREMAISRGAQITETKVNFDFGCWLTPQTDLDCLGLNFKDIQESGYIDIQLLWEAMDRPLCLTLGAGAQKTAHSPDEYIELEKLEKLPQLLESVLQKLS